MGLEKFIQRNKIYIVIFIAILLIFFAYRLLNRKHGNDLQLSYYKSESKVYSQELKNSVDDTKAYNDIISMPLHSITNANIGIIYCNANIIETDKPNVVDVIQIVTYIFNGTDTKFPKGSITVRIYFQNDKSEIFPPDNTYVAHIISGSDAYVNATGTIKIDVKGDQRNAHIHFTHI
jgi:predicted RND superfamily exporter protein